jgi:folylpolyglutamate synthase
MCYTSPHQTDVRDRFLINNKQIPKWLFTYYIQKLHYKIQSLQPGLEPFPPPLYPGFLALLAIYIFISEKIDVLVLETGIGGETDSTNVFPHPVATGITSIGLDHVQVLGSTIEEIAWHKAGIFKHSSPAFTVAQDNAILDVFRRRAQEKGTAGGLQVVTDSRILEYGIKLSPDMQYQRQNAALAIKLVESYLSSKDTPVSITNEVATTLQDTELPGRSQVVAGKDNTWFISVAHNDISLKETISWFKSVVQQSG